jgi:hypothetical protein
MPAETSGRAIHIGADTLTDPRHAHLAALRSCRDTVTRFSRLAAASGITEQRVLAGVCATRARVRAALQRAATELDPRAQLLLTFTGHTDPDDHRADGSRDVAWCLYDGALRLAEVAALLAAVPPTARIIVVSDTCYAAALSRYSIRATVILVAACGASQQILARPATGFAARLEQLVMPGGRRNPQCTSYAWLDTQLGLDSPDVERPCVWTNATAARAERPFAPARYAVQPLS